MGRIPNLENFREKSQKVRSMIDVVTQNTLADPTRTSLTQPGKTDSDPAWMIVIGVAGGVFAALLVTVIIWCIVKQKTKIKHKFSKRSFFKKENLANGGNHTGEKKDVTKPKIYFHSPTRTDLEQCMVPSEPMKYFPQTDICSVTDVDPDLYKEDDFFGEGSPFMGPARLCFSLHYNKNEEKLLVKLIRATRLTPRGNNITVNPFVKIFLLPDKKRKVHSKVCQRTSNPEFKEEFVFSVPENVLAERTLKFSMYDLDKFSRQQMLGHVVYPLKDIEQLSSDEGSGEIWIDITGQDNKDNVDKGEVLFSMQYLPVAEKLTISILKAKSLKLDGEETDLDPYVKVSLIMNGKVAKKKKTSVVKRNNNPVYNEAFSFTVPPSCLDRVSFMVSVIANPRLGSSKKLIGRAVVGPYMYSTGAGLSHWNDMLASPKSAVAQWHALI